MRSIAAHTTTFPYPIASCNQRVVTVIFRKYSSIQVKVLIIIILKDVFYLGGGMGFIQIVGKDAVTLVNFNVCCAWVSWWFFGGSLKKVTLGGGQGGGLAGQNVTFFKVVFKIHFKPF